MLRLIRTDSTNQDFIRLTKALDINLEETDGEDNAFYVQFNGIDTIKYAIVAYKEEEAVACGAIKKYTSDTMEIKRMYTTPNSRGMGTASAILKELETWTVQLLCNRCILETGKRQVEAIRLYEKNGYQRISNYGQYVIMENSVCFEKIVG